VSEEREKEEKVKEERAETAEMMLLLYRGLWGIQSAKTRACESPWNTSGLVIFPAWLKVPDMASFKGSPVSRFNPQVSPLTALGQALPVTND
jgi:hypothetical protein